MSDNGTASANGGDRPTHGSANSSSKAKAELEKDVERLEAILSTERFCIAITIIVVFDAFMFKDYRTWGSPIALLIIQLAGLFVLARRLGVDELITLTRQLVRSWGKKGESDPPQ
jgi:hypothetical protein